MKLRFFIKILMFYGVYLRFVSLFDCTRVCLTVQKTGFDLVQEGATLWLELRSLITLAYK